MKSASRPAPQLVVAFYTTFLLWVATRPGAALLWAEVFWDKARHAGAFFVLTALTAWSLGFFEPLQGSRVVRAASAALYSLTIGGLIEFFQIRVPGRTADLTDFAADAFGTAAAVLAVWTILRIKERRKPNLHGAHPRAF